jgi:hypothetical protein
VALRRRGAVPPHALRQVLAHVTDPVPRALAVYAGPSAGSLRTSYKQASDFGVYLRMMRH